MGHGQGADEQRYSVDFLLAEYRGHRESFWKSEEIGERRVNFFISIVTAVLAALVIRQKGLLTPGGEVDPIFFYGLGAVLLFGIVTLARLIRRNLESHKQLRALGRIRKCFVKNYPATGQYLYYEPVDDRPFREKKWKEIISFGTGGLVETVALVNSLIVAALCALLAVCRSPWKTWLFGGVGFIVAWTVQFAYVWWRYREGGPKPDEIKFPGD